jgi:Flp pilus assembly protein TadD
MGRAADTRRPSELWVATLLAVAVALSLGVSLRGGFVWDDAPLISENRLVQDPSEILNILTSSFWETGDRHDRFRSFFRPLVSLSYALDYAVWGPRPAGFHLTNLLLHFSCCWLVYRLALAEGIGPWGALAGAALFAVHPVHVESVAWISGRTDLVCGVFLLGAFLLHRKAASRGARALRVASWLLFTLALFSKEMAATLPALVFADVWYSADKRKRRLARAWAAAIPYLIVLGLYVAARSQALGQGAPPLFTLEGQALVATSLFVLARYLTLLILPVGLDAHYPYAPLESLLTSLALVSGTMLLIALLATRRFARRSPRLLFWGAWIFVGLLPVLAFGRFGDVLLADRFLYLPSVGLAVLAARLVDPVLARVSWTPLARRVAVAGAALLVVLGGLSFKRTLVWRDDRTLFSDMLRTSPSSALVRNNLGLSLYKSGEFDRASEQFRLAVELSPGYALAHNNLAAALEREGRLEQAQAHYRQALELAPGLAEAGANAGNLLVRLGRPAEGLALLRELVELHPRSANVLYALADALNRTGRTEEALPLAEQVRKIDSRHASAHYLLGKIHHERGEGAAAADSMRRFLELWTDEGEHADAARRIITQVEAQVEGRAAASGS